MTKAELLNKAKLLPLLPGVYIMKGKGGCVIYVGKAKELQKRVTQYFRDTTHTIKVERMVSSVVDFDTIVTASEFEALILECSQIKLHSPKYNILLKDDKGYSYIRITNDEYPRIQAVLQKENDNARYIGPYTSSFAIREMTETANTAFKLPICNLVFPRDFNKFRPCLNHHIGRCIGLCNGKVSKADYLSLVEGATTLITKGQKELLTILNARMMEEADALRFEKAAEIRNQIEAIRRMNKGQRVSLSGKTEQDVISAVFYSGRAAVAVLRFRGGRLYDKKEFVFEDPDPAALREEFLLQYYGGELPIPKRIVIDEDFEGRELFKQLVTEIKGVNVDILVPQKGDLKSLVEMARVNASERLTRDAGRTGRYDRLLDNLSKLLSLPAPPHRIEAFDISNWGEGSSVAGMIVFEEAKPYKAGYRRFAMKTVSGTDDYASINEVLTRRIDNYIRKTDAEFSKLPDLVLLDGGLGQLNSARKASISTDFEFVPFFGMVKDNRHRTRGLICEDGEIALSLHKELFSFITKIQDETHRFAISYERKRAKTKSYASNLVGIAGVGTATQKKLFASFKTITKIRNASEAELVAAGISEKVAKNIVAHFDNNTKK